MSLSPHYFNFRKNKKVDEKKIKDSMLVDGLIDLIVVAIGTLDILGVDTDKAWDEVHGANMSKEPGIKESRPNPLGLPDMIKKPDWKGPNHEGNTGRLDEFLKIKNK